MRRDPDYRRGDIACCHILYSAPIATAPSALLIDVPEGQWSGALTLERFYPIIIESDAEPIEFEAFLRVRPVAHHAPDLPDRRPSRL